MRCQVFYKRVASLTLSGAYLEATLAGRPSIFEQGTTRTPRGSGIPAACDPGDRDHPVVAIVLSAHNGELFLQEQLDSLARQTHGGWVLFWRDDGSSDAALGVLQRFETLVGPRKSRFVPRRGKLGATRSYLTLLASAWHEQFQYFAFADQDDVWFDDKIERGLAALADVPPDLPALYCGRQELVDDQLRYLGMSPALVREAGFPTALTQNIATGCTILLNRAAVEVALSDPRARRPRCTTGGAISPSPPPAAGSSSIPARCCNIASMTATWSGPRSARCAVALPRCAAVLAPSWRCSAGMSPRCRRTPICYRTVRAPTLSSFPPRSRAVGSTSCAPSACEAFAGRHGWKTWCSGSGSCWDRPAAWARPSAFPVPLLDSAGNAK